MLQYDNILLLIDCYPQKSEYYNPEMHIYFLSEHKGLDMYLILSIFV